MITNVNFKSFEELCPEAKIDFDNKKCSAFFMAKAVKEYAGCYIVKKCLNGEWHYKIGYKGKTETNRLDKYNVRDIICLGFIFGEPNEKERFDEDIHKNFENFFNIRFKGSEGVFEGSDSEWCHYNGFKENDEQFIKDCKQACYYYRTGTKPKAIKTQFWGPRVGSQDKCIEKAFKYFSNNNSFNEFLIAAKCRYGKCYTSLKIIDKLETENVLKHHLHLITSYRPSDIIAEWYDTVITHNDFNWDVFVHPSLQNKFPHAKTLDDLNKNSKGIVIASTQCLIKKSKINDEVDYSKYSKKLQNLKFGVVCADEDDVGNNKENAINFRANNLNYENVIRITGTAYQELIWESNKFNDENTYIFDYIEEQKLKAQYKHLGINNPYKDMASMKFYTINLAEKIFNEEIKSEKGFSLNEFFRTTENDKTKFVHEIQVLKHIKKTLNVDECMENEEQWAIFDSFPIKNVLIKLPAGTIDAFDKLFKNLGYRNYEFIKYTGENRDAKNKEELVSKIEKANAENKKTITYTVYRLGRGVSVKQFDSVLHWAGTEESDIGCYEQFNFRGQTPNSNKEVCYVFDYAPNRISLMQEQIAVFRAKRYEKTIEEVRKEVLNYYPAFKLNNCNWVKKSYEDYLNELSLVRDTKALTEELVKVSPSGFLDKMKISNTLVQVNTNNVTKVKYKTSGPKTKNSGELLTEEEILEQLKRKEETDIKKQKRKFVECLNNTLRFVWVRNNGKPFNSKIYKKLINDTKVQDWISDAELNIPNYFYELLDEAYTNSYFVISFDRYLISTYNEKSFNELCPIKLGKNEYKTPLKYIEKMWAYSLSNDKLKNNEIFFEPCSKTGEFSKFAIDNKYVKKENCYFNTRNRWSAALTSLNIFGDFNYKKFKTNIFISKIENDIINIETIIENKIKNKICNFNEGDFTMPVPDRIYMNPPYDNNLHFDIMEKLSKCYKTRLLDISPVGKLQDPTAQHDKSSEYFKYENSILKHIEKLEVIKSSDAEKEFKGARFGVDLAIYVLTEKGGFDYFNFNNDTIINKVLNKLHSLKENEKVKIEQNKKDGYRVRICRCNNTSQIHGVKYKDIKPLGDLYVFYNGMKDGKKWYNFWKKNQHTKETDEITDSIHFDTEDEANNFVSFFDTKCGKYIQIKLCTNQFFPVDTGSKLVWLNDYKKKYTEKDIIDYYGIEGYIDDNTGEPGSEWEKILNTMEEIK